MDDYQLPDELPDIPSGNSFIPKEILKASETQYLIAWYPDESGMDIEEPSWIDKSLICDKELIDAWMKKVQAQNIEKARGRKYLMSTYGIGYYEGATDIHSRAYEKDEPTKGPPSPSETLETRRILPATSTEPKPSERPAPDELRKLAQLIANPPYHKTNREGLPFATWLHMTFPNHFANKTRRLLSGSPLRNYTHQQLGISSKVWEWINLPQPTSKRSRSSSTKTADAEQAQTKRTCNQELLHPDHTHYGIVQPCKTHLTPFNVCEGCRHNYIVAGFTDEQVLAVQEGARVAVCQGCATTAHGEHGNNYRGCKCDLLWTCAQCRRADLNALVFNREKAKIGHCGLCDLGVAVSGNGVKYCMECYKFNITTFTPRDW